MSNEDFDPTDLQASPVPPPKGAPTWLRVTLPLLFLAIGVAVVVVAKRSRSGPKRKAAQGPRGILVETVTAHVGKRAVTVVGNGTIQPRREATLAAQVSGPVKKTHRAFVVGGALRKGEVMLTIDATDYRLAVERARAQVAQSQQQLAMTQARARVAREEWRRLGNAEGKASPLTLQKPQLRSAQAVLAGARAGLKQAKVNLSRTVVRAPFNVRIRKKMVDIGQYVRLGTALVTVYGTDIAEAVVSLPLSEVRWLDLPRAGQGVAKGAGPDATIKLLTGVGVARRPGRLVRSVGEVDRSGRMTRVVVALDDPYNLRNKDRSMPDFEVGAFVTVELAGRTLDKVVALPTRAVRVGSVVWVAAADDTLQRRSVTVAKRTTKEALITAGLNEGERVILTNINGAVEGMKLRIALPKAAPPAGALSQASAGGAE